MKDRIVYALGFFDGVHLGHQALLAAARELAGETGCVPGVLTFTGHPDALTRGCSPRLINTPHDREQLLRHYGAETVVSLPFDKTLMDTPWEAFFNSLLRRDAAGFVCGEDFRFGAGGKGTAALLEKACRDVGIPCRVVPQQLCGGEVISSTRIRALLEAGGVEQAAELLGHPHILTGTVVSGRQLGRTIGIPTANLLLPEEGIALCRGVYACKARTGEGEYLAVTNVGTRPTVGGSHITVEPWLLDFSGDLYGKNLTLEFYAFLRPERKFPSLEALGEEILKNAEETRKIFGKN